jgi:carbamoyltransferase
MGTELDVLVVGGCVLKKEQQDINLIEDYKDKYERD